MTQGAGVTVTLRVSNDGKSTYEEIAPVMPLAAKVTLGHGIDAAMLAKAEAAVADMAADYHVWAAEDLARLRDAAAALRALPSAERGCALYAAAHDVKGQGGSFGYPLVTRIAASLCRLLYRREGFDSRHLDAVDAHLDALGVVIGQRLAGEQKGAGAALAGQLELLVGAIA
jgi:hypothetical protein